MALTLKTTKQFKKDLRQAIKSGLPEDEIKTVIQTLAKQVQLEGKYKDHKLSGNWVGHRECHICPDWLLIYKVNDKELELILVRAGSHSELFG